MTLGVERFWQVGALENKCKKLLQGLKAARAEMSVQAVSWQMCRRSHFPETRDDHHPLGSDMMIWVLMRQQVKSLRKKLCLIP